MKVVTAATKYFQEFIDFDVSKSQGKDEIRKVAPSSAYQWWPNSCLRFGADDAFFNVY